ncbi:MAG: DegT/DnrJ/EryC1/StrS family aminotransferase [Xanthobacteraceae bacterium]|nr:MAG: DegT/DnrJ/EryC1/StrS family aminotransferase [Xanthobacteraceae bacterium]
MIRLPQAAPQLRIKRFRAEIDTAIRQVIDGSHYILGPALERFEAQFAAYLGVRHCIGVASGTDALALALRALGIGAGDEVITTALTAAGTAQAILHCGARPCFVDVDAVTRCIDPAAVEAAITPRTRAIVPVHLFGHAADMARLAAIARTHHLALVEDCAQAHGAYSDGRKVGGFGHAGAFSFYPTKNLGGIGDGGAIVSNDVAFADRVRALRCYGWNDDHRVSAAVGFNSRLDEMQAAILGALLPHLDAGNAERRMLASHYREALADLGVGLPPDPDGCVYQQFAITCDGRDGLRSHLARAGIGTAVHYTPPLHVQPAFATISIPALPRTEELARRLISLPIQPEMAGGEFARAAAAVKEGILQWKMS